MERSHQDSTAGYVDAHAHVRGIAAIDDIVKAGVTAVRDAGSFRGAGLALQEADGASGMPRLRSAGRALMKKSGYGALLGVPVETREEIEQEVRALRQEGAAIIKVIASGVVSFKCPGTVTAGGFGRDELRFIVEVARDHGLAVMAHANGADAIRNAAEAGVASVEHGFFMTEAELGLLERSGIYWVPTVGALQRAGERPDAALDTHAFVERTISEHCAMIRKAYRRGVHLAIGTDAVLPDRRYRSYYEMELAYFRRAGIPGEEIERIARGTASRLPGL